MTEAQVSEVIKSVDADRNGTIEYGEFVSRLAAEWEWEDRPAVPPPPPAVSPAADGEKGKAEDKSDEKEEGAAVEGDKTADAKVSPRRSSEQDLWMF